METIAKKGLRGNLVKLLTELTTATTQAAQLAKLAVDADDPTTARLFASGDLPTLLARATDDKKLGMLIARAISSRRVFLERELVAYVRDVVRPLAMAIAASSSDATDVPLVEYIRSVLAVARAAPVRSWLELDADALLRAFGGRAPIARGRRKRLVVVQLQRSCRPQGHAPAASFGDFVSCAFIAAALSPVIVAGNDGVEEDAGGDSACQSVEAAESQQSDDRVEVVPTGAPRALKAIAKLDQMRHLDMRPTYLMLVRGGLADIITRAFGSPDWLSTSVGRTVVDTASSYIPTDGGATTVERAHYILGLDPASSELLSTVTAALAAVDNEAVAEIAASLSRAALSITKDRFEAPRGGSSAVAQASTSDAPFDVAELAA